MKNIFDTHIRFSLEQENMLNELVEFEKKEAEKSGRTPLSKAQIIKQAVKEFYASRRNTSAANAYVELIQNSIEPLLSSFFELQDKKMNSVIRKLERLNAKELLLLKLNLMGTDLKECSDINHQIAVKLLNEKGGFEDAINSKLDEITNKGKD